MTPVEMRFSLHALLRWCNHHPLWSWGTTVVWDLALRAPTFDRWLALRLHRAAWMGVADKRFLSTHVKPGMTVVDIGANQGLYSLLFARLVEGSGKVHAFEPDEMLYRALERNVQLNGAENIQTYPLALGAQSGTMQLHRSLFNSGDNRLASKAKESGPRESVQIRMQRLDEVLTNDPVDFIKLDVQGWEMEVFRGMQGLLDRGRHKSLAIYFEFWPQGLLDAGCEPVELLQFLVSNGFVIHRPCGNHLGSSVDDLQRFVGSIKPHVYINLYAFRAVD